MIGRLKALGFVIPPEIFDHYGLFRACFMALADIVREFFERECVFTQDAYRVATEEELQRDIEWMRQRPHTLLRYDYKSLKKEYPHHVRSILAIENPLSQ